MTAEIPIISGKPEAQQLVEVCRSFAYKLNLANHGGPAYESADFFASRKLQCAAEDVPWVSQQVFEECVAEVKASVQFFLEEMKQKLARKAEPKRKTA